MSRRGRPKGSKNIEDVVTVPTSSCPKCGSTERTPYTNRTEIEAHGLFAGKPFTHVVWRSTACAQCGQRRRDKTFEYRPE